MFRIAIANFGCRTNFAETELIEDDLRKYTPVDVTALRPSDRVQPFDAVIINSSTVTDAADKECRALIRKISRQNPKPIIAVIGCYVTRSGKEISELEGVDKVFSSQEKMKVVPWLAETLGLSFLEQNSISSFFTFPVFPWIRWPFFSYLL